MAAGRLHGPPPDKEQQYRLLFDANPCPMFIFDEDTLQFLDVNKAALQLYGWSRRALLKMTATQIRPPEDVPAFLESLKRHRELRTVFVGEWRHVKRDGQVFDVAVTVSSIFHAGREARLVLVHDITERKRAEEELRALTQVLEQRVAERTKALQMLHDVATMANQAQNTEQAIRHCLQRVAECNAWCFGHALLPAADNPDVLLAGYACYTRDAERFRPFREATLAHRLRRGQGLPGRVLASGKLEWTTDLKRDLVDRRAAICDQMQFGTAVAFPVMVREKVAAVLEFFSDQVIEPDAKIADAMVGVGLQLGRVIERDEFEEHLLAIAEEMQRRIAQDLHDDIGQELTGLGLKAATLVEMLGPAAAPAAKLAADIAAALDRTHDKVRMLCRGMLPIELEEGLLASALEQLAAATSDSSRIECRFHCLHPEPVFDSRVAMHLYRIAQEAVANAVRHSGARNIRITLARHGGQSELKIEDDGAGPASELAQSEGMGLRIMRYRAGLIGAKLQVGRGRRRGMQVVCRLSTHYR